MAYILAGLMAAASFLLNRLFIRRFGEGAITKLGPALEEAAKTLPAYWLGADILATHVAFGVVEAGYDFFSSSRRKTAAALAGIAGHSLFGLLAAGAISWTQNAWLGFAAGWAAHAAWNSAIMYLVKLRSRN